MALDWSSKHVAVTGASSGIGEAIALELARAGARVTLVARRQALLDALVAKIVGAGGRAVALTHDLADPARATEWLARAEEGLGPIDVLVNNAGMDNSGPITRSSAVEATQLLHLNLHAPLLITHALLPRMVARGSGIIVNVSSLSALTPTFLQAWYAASKGGLAAFSEALHAELHSTGVQVLTVYPGPIPTAMSEKSYQTFGGRKGVVALVPEGDVTELAQLIRKAVDKGDARLVYPRFYALNRWFPWLARWIVDLAAPPYPKD